MSKVNEAIEILKQMGVPKAQQNERSALTLLALLDLKEETPWDKATQRLMRIHDILEFIKINYGKEYAENTREIIRRQTLHQFEQAGIVIRNPDDPKRPTNSPKTVYSVTDDAFEVIKRYGTPEWENYLQKFIENKGKLIEKYRKIRTKHQISIKVEDVVSTFSPGKHNELQVKIITDLKSIFFPHAELVYIGDTAIKMLYVNKNLLRDLGIPITEHDKLPDVVFYDGKRNLLILIEAVTSHGPISPKRQIELEAVLKDCKAKRVYISAFPNLKKFKRHIDNIAWETEVWISDNPSHMIHFNGPKFLYAHQGEDL
jgi:adenine-specific DNA-methyltransferase